MSHPITVEQLLELHRLGELYVKWATNPTAMSEGDLIELETVSAEYNIPGTSALFAFQKQFHEEFGLTAENTKPVAAVAEELRRLAIPPLLVRREPMMPTAGVPTQEDLARFHAALQRSVDEDDSEALKVQKLEEIEERNQALREAVAEDNAIAREQEREYQIDNLLLQAAEAEDWVTELQILQKAKDLGRIPASAEERIDWLVNSLKNADQGETTVRSIRVPAGVVQDAISTGHIEKVK